MLIEIFKNRKQIWEGLKNNIFKQEHVEAVYGQRLEVCKGCESYDIKGSGCAVTGTQPCCNKDSGGCGCSLSVKLRSLSTNCPKEKWLAVTDEQEEGMIRQQILNNRLSNDPKNGR